MHRYTVRRWYDCPKCGETEVVEVTATVSGRQIVEEEVTQEHCELFWTEAAELERRIVEDLLS